MSYTPQPPQPPQPPFAPSGYGTPAPYAPVPPAGAPPRRASRWPALIVLLAGLVAGGALVYAGGTAVQGTVEAFARAPVGCTTSLEFDRAGTFQVYVETSGRIDSPGGDCPVVGTYSVQGDRASVEFLIVDESGVALDVQEAGGTEYAVGDYAGEKVATVEVPSAGSYRITVSGDEGAAVAIGGGLGSGGVLLVVGGVVVGLAGVVLAIVMFLRARRRDRGPGMPTTVAPSYPVAAPPPGAWAPQSAPPAPGYGQMVPPPGAPPPPPGWGAPPH